MSARVVDSTGHEISPGHVVAWVAEGIEYEGEVLSIVGKPPGRVNLFVALGVWEQQAGNKVGFRHRSSQVFHLRPDVVQVIGWHDAAGQFSWRKGT